MKKRIIVISLIILIVIAIAGIYVTYASNSTVVSNGDIYNINLYDETSVTLNANSSKTIFYHIVNNNKGIVKYGIGYTNNPNVEVKIWIDSNDTETDFFDFGDNKFVKLQVINNTNSSQTTKISTVLGYENGGELIAPSGVTLVTKKYFEQSFLKSSDVISNGNQTFLNTSLTRSSIEKLSMTDSISILDDTVETFDVSEDDDESIILWYTDDDNNGLYEVYIGSNTGMVSANEDSSYLFSYMTNLKILDLNLFDTSSATDMSNLFLGSNSLTEVILGSEFSFDDTSSYLPNSSSGKWYDENNECTSEEIAQRDRTVREVYTSTSQFSSVPISEVRTLTIASPNGGSKYLNYNVSTSKVDDSGSFGISFGYFAFSIPYYFSVFGIGSNYMNTTAEVTLNATAMNVLYPTANAHPYRLDSYQLAAAGNSGSTATPLDSNNSVTLYIDNNEIHKVTSDQIVNYWDNQNGVPYITSTVENVTSDAVINSNKSSVYKYIINKQSSAIGIGDRSASISLYFWKYSFNAKAVNNGISSATVSSSVGYEEEQITFTATVVNGKSFDGWYSDSNCTNLVSRDLSYTLTVTNECKRLYAKAR